MARRRPAAEALDVLPAALRPQPPDADAWVGVDELPPPDVAGTWFWPRWREFVAQKRLQAAREAWCAERGLDPRAEARRWRWWWRDGQP